MKEIIEIINIALLKYGNNLSKEEINNIPFSERVLLSYEVIQKYKITNKVIPSIEVIGIVMDKLNISKVHIIERKRIVNYALQPFTCSELFAAFPDATEQLSDQNIELIQSSIDFAIEDSLKNYLYVSNEDGFGPDVVNSALQVAADDLTKLKEFLDERHINYNSENINHWINLAKNSKKNK